MNGSSNEILSRPCFTGDQDGCIRMSDRSHLAKNVVQSGTFANDSIEFAFTPDVIFNVFSCRCQPGL